MSFTDSLWTSGVTFWALKTFSGSSRTTSLFCWMVGSVVNRSAACTLFSVRSFTRVDWAPASNGRNSLNSMP